MPEKKEPAQRQMTLEEYARGIDQLNRDLQRQTDAYGYIRKIRAALDNLPKSKDFLPYITLTFPTDSADGLPGAIKLDLRTMPDEVVQQMQPLFETMLDNAGEELLTAWERIHTIVEHTSAIVEAGRAARGGKRDG